MSPGTEPGIHTAPAIGELTTQRKAMCWWQGKVTTMLYFGLLDVLVLLLAIVDIASTDDHEARGMPRLLWIFIVLLLPLAGSIAWFVAGRPAVATPRNRTLNDRRFPEYDKPGRFIPEDPAADEEFLRRCRERAEQQRRAAKLKRAQDGTEGHDAG